MSEAVLTPESTARMPVSQIGPATRVRYLLGLAAVAAGYYGSARVGYELGFSGPIAAIVWLPVGVGIAALCLGGMALWPGVLVGDLLVDNYTAPPVGSAIGQTIGNVLEVVVAAFLIRRLMRSGSPLNSVSGLGGLFVAIATGTAISATIGVVSLRLGHVITVREVPNIWRTWLLGDACGAIVVVPLVLAWYRPPRFSWWSARVVEASVMLVSVAVLSAFALHSHSPPVYLVFPALIWAALRFGLQGATLAITITIGFAVWSTAHYLGPFSFQSITRSILDTQLFIVVAELATLSLAAVVAEREEVARRLAASRARLVEAADTERRRLERNLHDGAQQRLTTLAVQLRRAAKYPGQAPEQVAALEDAETGLQLAIDDLRVLAHGIHPSVLTDLGLGPAIKNIAARTTVPVKLLEVPVARLDATAEATAYYVFSEAFANAQKYSNASALRIRALMHRHALYIEVADDGVGGATESPGSGLGGLRDRVEATGGTFRVDSVRGRGTRVMAVIPVAVSR